jgi:hypothetical protein
MKITPTMTSGTTTAATTPDELPEHWKLVILSPATSVGEEHLQTYGRMSKYLNWRF